MQIAILSNEPGKIYADFIHKGKSFEISWSAHGIDAIGAGLILANFPRNDLIKAAEFLWKEKAAESCVCGGYTIAKIYEEI